MLSELGALCFVLVEVLFGYTDREVSEVEAQKSKRANQCRMFWNRQARSDNESWDTRPRKRITWDHDDSWRARV